MVKVFNAVLVVALLVSAFFLYSLEHSTRGLERQVAKLKAGITDQREAIKLLNAEWSSLIRPERLQKLAEEKLKLHTVTASQVVSIEELSAKIPAAPVVKVEEQGSDPIGAILEKMQ
jgi:cell division protein FtsL